MIPLHIFLLFGMIEPNIPILAPVEVERLSYALDGRDSLDDGFAVLVEHVRQWDWQAPLEDGMELQVNLAEIVSDPVAFRGSAMFVSGEIEQQSTVPSWNRVEEWFVRDATGTPFVLYVVGDTQLSNRSSIMAYARFYKTMALTGRDGRDRSFPAFVTSGQAVVARHESDAIPLPLILIPIITLGAMVVFLLGRNRAGTSLRIRELPIHPEDVLRAAEDAATDLPDDPAEALAVLHECAEINS